jgi:hypothetical protein
MNESFPTPIQLNENPELAVLRLLKTNLEVAEVALLAEYPDCEEPDWERQHSEQEAYVTAILHQIDALEATLDEYAKSIRRLRSWRNREPTDQDIRF